VFSWLGERLLGQTKIIGRSRCMKLYVESETGEPKTFVIPDDRLSDIEAIANQSLPPSRLDAYIDQLEISADFKVMLTKIAKVTVQIGSTLLRAGQKIIELALFIVERYRNATFGIIFGLLLGTIASTIPILGVVLGAFVQPVAAIIGGMLGYIDDLRDENLRRTVKEAVATFNPLREAQNVAG
jgi:hypothetical protein